MTKLGIIRHGSTNWNVEGRAQGNSDIALNEEGVLDAHKLTERLVKENWDVIYSSNLRRAVQTAEIIAKKAKLQIHLDSRLREVAGGLIEGTTEAERVQKWGNKWWELDLGIEENDLVRERGLSIIQDIKNEHPNKNVLIVSHGAFIKQLLKEIIPLEEMSEALKNTSITTVINKENEWKCEKYNCVNHLVLNSKL
jgi:2,3-bisphosphoglycerate-dependent phosphoglycerate mutase